MDRFSRPWRYLTLLLAALASAEPEILRDELGNAKGRIRTPYVDAPIPALPGLGQSGEGFRLLVGFLLKPDAELIKAAAAASDIGSGGQVALRRHPG